MDIQEAMARVGLTPRIESAIADPAFSDMLWTRDLHFWVKDTIETNHATLRSRQELLKRHAQGLVPPQEGPALEAPEPGAITATIRVKPSTLRSDMVFNGLEGVRLDLQAGDGATSKVGLSRDVDLINSHISN
jgi:hypothetical protein